MRNFIATIYKGHTSLDRHCVGCIDEKGYVYNTQAALSRHFVGRIDDKNRLYRSTGSSNYVGHVNHKGVVYDRSGSNIAGMIDAKGRVYFQRSHNLVANITGSDIFAGGAAFLLLLNADNNRNDELAKFSLSAGLALLLLSDDEDGGGNTTEGCYIATAIYGDYSASEVLVLRKFRDEVLSKSQLGRLIVKLYYSLSPPIATWLESKTGFNRVIKVALDKIVELIDK